jgi:hypothetical protein
MGCSNDPELLQEKLGDVQESANVCGGAAIIGISSPKARMIRDGSERKMPLMQKIRKRNKVDLLSRLR